jgi:hypothetical protein
VEKHLYVVFGDVLGMGKTEEDLKLPAIATGRAGLPFADICSESFTTENGTYHYQPEYRLEALAYLASKGVKIPQPN